MADVPRLLLDQGFVQVVARGGDFQRARLHREVGVTLHALAARVGRLELEFAVARDDEVALTPEAVLGRCLSVGLRAVVEFVDRATMQMERRGTRVFDVERGLSRLGREIQPVEDDGGHVVGLVGETALRLTAQTDDWPFVGRQVTFEGDIGRLINLNEE